MFISFVEMSAAAAGIGYKDISVRPIKDRYGNTMLRQPRIEPPLLEGEIHNLNIREPQEKFTPLLPMQTVTVDCGENGRFSADEFRTMSAPGSMELISPEEVAEVAVQELLGIPTGHNVLAAMSSSVLAPGYRAGSLRPFADHYLNEILEHRCNDESTECFSSRAPTVPSIATGNLGPQLSNFLYEAHLLKLYFDGEDGLDQLAACDPVSLSRLICEDIRRTLGSSVPADLASGQPGIESLSRLPPTIGVPILLDDYSLVRGPNITDPEPKGNDVCFPVDRSQVNVYARRGWVDLRPENLKVWKHRAEHILSEPPIHLTDTTSLSGLHYSASRTHIIEPAAFTSWILAGELHANRDWDTVSEVSDEEEIAS
jgi:hypothetical protein